MTKGLTKKVTFNLRRRPARLRRPTRPRSHRLGSGMAAAARRAPAGAERAGMGGGAARRGPEYLT